MTDGERLQVLWDTDCRLLCSKAFGEGKPYIGIRLASARGAGHDSLPLRCSHEVKGHHRRLVVQHWARIPDDRSIQQDVAGRLGIFINDHTRQRLGVQMYVELHRLSSPRRYSSAHRFYFPRQCFDL